MINARFMNRKRQRRSVVYDGNVYVVFRVGGPYVTLFRGSDLICVPKKEVQFL